MVRYKYAPKMKIGFVHFLYKKLKIFLFVIVDYFVDKIDTRNQPVFVLGCGHSGTSLLTTILSRNSEVFPIGYETGIFLPENGLYIAKKMIYSWDMLSLQYNKTIILEKTPKHILCLKRIFRLVPHAKIIILIRDGRDTIVSLNKRINDMKSAIMRWRNENKEVVKWKNDPRIYIVRYEDLVYSPRIEIKKLSEWLSIDYENEMIMAGDNPYSHNNTGNMSIRSKQVSKQIYKNTGKWKNELNTKDLSIFMKKAGIIMKELKYY